MERPFEKRHVSERFRKPRRRRIALGPAAPLGQQDDREVGPGRLLAQEVCEGSEIGITDRFVGDDREAGSPDNLLAQRPQIAANIGGTTRFFKDQRCDLCIASVRREYDCTLRKRARTTYFSSPSSKVVRTPE